MGARWFIARHIAFTFDIRLYASKDVATTIDYAGRDKKHLLLLSAAKRTSDTVQSNVARRRC